MKSIILIIKNNCSIVLIDQNDTGKWNFFIYKYIYDLFIKFVYKRSSLDMKQFVLYSSFLNKNVKLKIKIYLYMYLYIYLASLVCLLDELKIGMT